LYQVFIKIQKATTAAVGSSIRIEMAQLSAIDSLRPLKSEIFLDQKISTI
jgi:hypothetical protein